MFREVSNWNLCAGMKRLCLSMHRKPYILSPSLIPSFNCIQHQPAYMAKIDRMDYYCLTWDAQRTPTMCIENCLCFYLRTWQYINYKACREFFLHSCLPLNNGSFSYFTVLFPHSIFSLIRLSRARGIYEL